MICLIRVFFVPVRKFELMYLLFSDQWRGQEVPVEEVSTSSVLTIPFYVVV